MKRLQRLSQRTPQRKLDDNETVVVDVLCIECGVNLIRMSVHEKCPNCLHPVSDSVHGDYLIHTEPTRVRRLVDAARFVRYGALLLGGMVVLALLLALASELYRRDLIRGVGSVFRLLFAGAMIAPVLAAIGLGTLTNRRTFAYYQARYGNRQDLMTFAGAALLVVLLGGTGLALAPTFTSNLLLSLWATVPVAVFMSQLAALMRRVPNAQLASLANLAYYGVVLSGAALFGVRYLSVMAAHNPDHEQAYIAVAAIYIVLAIAFGIGAYRLLVMVERVLEKTAR